MQTSKWPVTTDTMGLMKTDTFSAHLVILASINERMMVIAQQFVPTFDSLIKVFTKWYDKKKDVPFS